jgi:hypothetical protein
MRFWEIASLPIEEKSMTKPQKSFFIFISIIFASVALLTTFACVKEKGIGRKVDELLRKMTLEEKIGQMTQYSRFNEERARWVREGKIGSFLNVHGAEQTNRIQKIAKEESRLGIPLIFGIDVIHGFRTIFPIPLKG